MTIADRPVMGIDGTILAGRLPEAGRRLVVAMGPVRVAVTLVELLLVIALLAALAAMVLPNLSGRRDVEQLRSAVRQLETLITLTRNEAMVRACRHRLHVSADGRRVWIEWEKDPLDHAGEFVAVKADWVEVNLGDRATRCVRLELSGSLRAVRHRERVAMEQSEELEGFESIEFLPDGRCDESLIVLQGPTGSRTALELNGLTGLVKVTERWEPKESLDNLNGGSLLE